MPEDAITSKKNRRSRSTGGNLTPVLRLLDRLDDGVALLDASGTILFVNDAWVGFGTANTADPRSNGTGVNYLHTCDRAGQRGCREAEKTAAGIRSVLNGLSSRFELEYACHARWERRWFRLLALPWIEGRTRRALVQHIDITRQKLAEEASRYAQRRLAQIARSVEDVSWVAAWADRKFIYVDPAIVELVGFRDDELVQDPGLLFDSIHILDRPRIRAGLSTLCRTGVYHDTLRFFRPEGEEIDVELNARLLTHGSAVGSDWIVEGFFRTSPSASNPNTIRRHGYSPAPAPSRQEAELEEMLESRRLEILGRLAHTVAHDFNNVLTTILGACNNENTSGEGRRETPTAELKQIAFAAQHASELTRRLLDFADNRERQPTWIDLNAAVGDFCVMMSRLMRKNIRLSFSPCEGEAVVKMEVSHLHQILMNLAINAQDAMKDGGKLWIDLHLVPHGRISLADGTMLMVNEPQVRIEIRDSGIGIPPENLRRIFDPGFSTKSAYGRGHGLATIRDIVSRNQGLITVESEVGSGSTFDIFFPLRVRESQPTRTTAERNERKDRPSGSGHLFLV